MTPTNYSEIFNAALNKKVEDFAQKIPTFKLDPNKVLDGKTYFSTELGKNVTAAQIKKTPAYALAKEFAKQRNCRLEVLSAECRELDESNEAIIQVNLAKGYKVPILEKINRLLDSVIAG